MNLEFPKPDLLEAAAVYVRANTPRYFFEQLRNAHATASLAARLSGNELTSRVNELVNFNAKTEEEGLAAALLLVAATLRPTAITADTIRLIDADSVPWGKHFLHMVATSLPMQQNTSNLTAEPIFTHEQNHNPATVTNWKQVEAPSIT